MKVHAEARPLHEPLAGGTPGATVTVEPLVAGHIDWPRATMVKSPGRFTQLKMASALLRGADLVKVPCPVYLIRHPSAGAILIDTGLHASIATDPRGNFGRLGAWFTKPSLKGGEDAPAQLRARGLDPGEIPIVVMTHLHFDHASAISEFPQSTFVFSEPEWEAATTAPRPLLNGYRRAHLDFAFDYRTIDFHRGGVESYATFGRSFDLFGDGSLRLVYTPGHSPGHISVIARLRERDFVIGGDVVYFEEQLSGDAALPPAPHDAHNYRRSLQELRLFKREFPAAIVTPGHDPDYLTALKPRYE